MAGQQHNQSDPRSHASPMISPLPRPSSQFLQGLDWSNVDRTQSSTPGIPDNLISPAFTPPLSPSLPSTPSHHEHDRRLGAEPKSFPVDTSLDDLSSAKPPKLMERLPVVECVVRARIPITSGAEMFLYLYQNDSDNKEHLAIVFGNSIRSRSLDAERPGETEMDRMIRGAYVGRLRPGRVSSRAEEEKKSRMKGQTSKNFHGSALKNMTVPEDAILEPSKFPDPPASESTIPDPSSSLSQTETQPQAQATENSDSSIPNLKQETASADLNTENETIPIYKPPLVRIHSECYTGETAWSARCDCGEQLDEAQRLMSLPSNVPHPGGVIVYLRQEGRGIGLASKLKAYNLQDLGNDTVEANLLLRHPADARTYGLATAILMDLGLGTDADAHKPENERGIRLLTNNPDKIRAVEGPGREVRVVERVAMVPIAWKSGGLKGVKGSEIERYLETKIGRMGHMLSK